MAYKMTGKEIDSAKAKLGDGAKFAEVRDSVAKEYEDKGRKASAAEAIGAKVAAKQGDKKYGIKKMSQLAQRGRVKRQVMPQSMA
jgi:hypothetical protein